MEREGERIISSRYVSEYPSSSFFFFFFGSLLIIVRFFRFPDLIPQVARLKQFLTRFRLFLSSSLSSFILDVSIYSFIRSIREYASVTVKRRCRKGVVFFFFFNRESFPFRMRFKVRKRCEVHDCFFFLFFFLGIKGSILRSGEFDSFSFFELRRT